LSTGDPDATACRGYAEPLSSGDLLDSARHKLRLARYHGETLLAVLAQRPPDDPDDPLRVALEAHLESLAYAGTAAAEKTIRSIDPDEFRSQTSVEAMIRVIRARGDSPEGDFARTFETWWSGRSRGTRYAQRARDLRNDAAHSFYEKAPGSGRWVMETRRPPPIPLDEFTFGYLQELEELTALVAEAEQLAIAAGR
jgi:hypothetical protein